MAHPTTFTDPDSLDFIDLLEYDELQQVYDPQRNPHTTCTSSRPNRSCDDQRCCSSAAKGNGIPLSQELDEADRKLFNPVVATAAPSSVQRQRTASSSRQGSAELFLRLDSSESVEDGADDECDATVTSTGGEYFGGEELQYENEFEDGLSGASGGGCAVDCSRVDGLFLGDNENEQLLLEGILLLS